MGSFGFLKIAGKTQIYFKWSDFMGSILYNKATKQTGEVAIWMHWKPAGAFKPCESAKDGRKGSG